MALSVKADGDCQILHGEAVAMPVLCFRSADFAKSLKRRYIRTLTTIHPSTRLVNIPGTLIMPSAMRSTAVFLFAASVAAQTATVTRTVAATTVFTTPGPSITAVSDCHPHSTVLYVYDYQRC
jgi:hypothetical protein